MAENVTKRIIKEFLNDAGLTMKQMIDTLNEVNPEAQTTVQNFSNKLTKETLRLKEVLQILDACGYELTIHKSGEPMQINSAADTNDEYLAELVSQQKPIYVHCKDDETAKRFLADCELDGIVFDDGKKPTEKECADLYRLLPGKRMCYVGAIGHIRWNANDGEITRIEY